VDLYQQKLDAAKKIRKLDKVQGVRNELAVSSTAPDSELAAKLERKLHYDRIGYDNEFNFVDVAVNGGVATLTGETRADMGRDSALFLANNMPGVKDVVDNIKFSPVWGFDDRIRQDPARPESASDFRPCRRIPFRSLLCPAERRNSCERGEAWMGSRGSAYDVPGRHHHGDDRSGSGVCQGRLRSYPAVTLRLTTIASKVYRRQFHHATNLYPSCVFAFTFICPNAPAPATHRSRALR